MFLPAIAVFEFQSKENSASTMSLHANFAKSSCLNGSCALPPTLAKDATVAVLHKVHLCFNGKGAALEQQESSDVFNVDF